VTVNNSNLKSINIVPEPPTVYDPVLGIQLDNTGALHPTQAQLWAVGDFDPDFWLVTYNCIWHPINGIASTDEGLVTAVGPGQFDLKALLFDGGGTSVEGQVKINVVGEAATGFDVVVPAGVTTGQTVQANLVAHYPTLPDQVLVAVWDIPTRTPFATAEVSNNAATRGQITTGDVGGTVTVKATYAGNDYTAIVDIGGRKPQSLAIAPADDDPLTPFNVPLNGSRQFKATLTCDDSYTKVVTDDVVWELTPDTAINAVLGAVAGLVNGGDTAGEAKLDAKDKQGGTILAPQVTLTIL